MASSVDELTVNWEEDGVLKVKELKKHVLSKGAWSTIMFLYQEMDGKTKEYKPAKIAIRRYRKRNNEYMLQSKFNISSKAQGEDIASMITEWYKDL